MSSTIHSEPPGCFSKFVSFLQYVTCQHPSRPMPNPNQIAPLPPPNHTTHTIVPIIAMQPPRIEPVFHFRGVHCSTPSPTLMSARTTDIPDSSIVLIPQSKGMISYPSSFLFDATQDTFIQNLLDYGRYEDLHNHLEESLLTHLKTDDLLLIIGTILTKIDTLCNEEERDEELHKTLFSFNGILDTISDANIFSSASFTEPLSPCLDALMQSEHLSIATQAAYAKQQLHNLPHNEAKLSCFLRKRFPELKEMASIAKAAVDKEPHDILQTYQEFTQKNGRKEKWVDELRVMKLLLRAEYFHDFEQFVYKRADIKNSPCLVLGITNLMERILYQPYSHAIQKRTLSFLSEIILNKHCWCSRVSDWVLARMIKYVVFSSKILREHLLGLIERIGKKGTGAQRVIIDNLFIRNIIYNYATIISNEEKGKKHTS